MRLLYTNYYLNTGGSAAPETNIANGISVLAAYQIGGGAWTPITRNGNSDLSLAAGEQFWCDAFGDIAKDTVVRVRTLCWVAAGLYRPGGMRVITSVGITEFGRRDADYNNLLPLLSGGTITSNLGGVDTDLYAPACAVIETAKDGPKSVLAATDSIGFGRNQTNGVAHNARNSIGFLGTGMDNAGYPVCIAGYQGAKLQFEGATNAGAAWLKRAAAFALLPSLPFDVIVANTLTNDLSSSYASMKGFIDGWISRARSLWPGKKLMHCTPLPKVGTGGTYTTAAGQTVIANANYPADPLWQARDYILTNCGGTIDGNLDISPMFWAYSNPDAGDPRDKWRYDGGAFTNDGTHPVDLGHVTVAGILASSLASAPL